MTRHRTLLLAAAALVRVPVAVCESRGARTSVEHEYRKEKIHGPLRALRKRLRQIV